MSNSLSNIKRVVHWLLFTLFVTLLSVLTAVSYVYSDDLLTAITTGFISLYILILFGFKIANRINNYCLSAEERLLQKTPSPLFNDIQSSLFSNLDAVYKVFNQMPIPVAMLSSEDNIVFFNHAMYRQLNMPICVGMKASECGFEINSGKIQHISFTKEWKLESFILAQGQLRLLTASYILEQLQKEKRSSQQNMIRILSHELNNSLTPIASISDSLLSNETGVESELQRGLERIKNRSEQLLEFVKRYSKLSQIPEPKLKHFNFKQMAVINAIEFAAQLNYQGSARVLADPVLIEQLLINLFKNASEDSRTDCKLFVSVSNDSRWQVIKVENAGDGFSNLKNALTPLYTTKKQGQGLGLALCSEIVEAHRGQISLSNTEVGACVELKLPLSQSPRKLESQVA